MRKALIVEDDPEIARLLQLHFADVGLHADVASRCATARTLFEHDRYDLVVLDLTLPDGDGVALCRHLRATASDYVPILMLTAKSSEDDRVNGLESGADDYLVKPFSVAELLARVKALLRRADAQSATRTDAAADRPLGSGELRIDPARRRVTLAGSEVALTVKEFDLLAFVAARPGRVFSRAQLLDEVWGYGHDGYEHTVNSHINRLRGKIERNPAEPRYVLTVWGVGYKFTEEP